MDDAQGFLEGLELLLEGTPFIEEKRWQERSLKEDSIRGAFDEDSELAGDNPFANLFMGADDDENCAEAWAAAPPSADGPRHVASYGQQQRVWGRPYSPPPQPHYSPQHSSHHRDAGRRRADEPPARLPPYATDAYCNEDGVMYRYPSAPEPPPLPPPQSTCWSRSAAPALSMHHHFAVRQSSQAVFHSRDAERFRDCHGFPFRDGFKAVPVTTLTVTPRHKQQQQLQQQQHHNQQQQHQQHHMQAPNKYRPPPHQQQQQRMVVEDDHFLCRDSLPPLPCRELPTSITSQYHPPRDITPRMAEVPPSLNCVGRDPIPLAPPLQVPISSSRAGAVLRRVQTGRRSRRAKAKVSAATAAAVAAAAAAAATADGGDGDDADADGTDGAAGPDGTKRGGRRPGSAAVPAGAVPATDEGTFALYRLDPTIWIIVERGAVCSEPLCGYYCPRRKESARRHFHAVCGHVHRKGKRSGLPFHTHQLEKAWKHERLHLCEATSNALRASGNNASNGANCNNSSSNSGHGNASSASGSVSISGPGIGSRPGIGATPGMTTASSICGGVGVDIDDDNSCSSSASCSPLKSSMSTCSTTSTVSLSHSFSSISSCGSIGISV